VERTSAPWRVFDAPTGEPGSSQALPSATGAATGSVSSLGIQPIALLGLVGAIALGVVAVFIAVGGMGPGRVVASPDDPAAPLGSSGPDTGVGVLVVDVSGAVVNPGVYRLAPGTRVGDAVSAAGGYGPRVDVQRVATELNLAEALTDGVRVHVPSRDDATGANGGGAEGPPGAGGAGGLVDLNRATQSELESLPGIGPVTATKIIAARDQTPFRSVDELRQRGLVGEKTFDSIRALITV